MSLGFAPRPRNPRRIASAATIGMPQIAASMARRSTARRSSSTPFMRTPPTASKPLLFGHCDQESVFWRDQVVVIVWRDPGVELDPLHLAGEWSPGASVIVGHRRPAVVADVARLLAERERLRTLDASLAALCSIDEQRELAAFGNTAAVVRELEANLMVSRRQAAAAFDEGLLQAEEVVADLRFAVLHVDAQAAGHAAQGDDDPFGATSGH